ncbi:hypothetical protein B0H11DRAFT_1392502 [Mycena galericulata]|nr:hypothetical protein B0H11DRAFT_1392502 [Mycena galericulata]
MSSPSEISVCDSCDAAFKQSPLLLAAAPHSSQFIDILRTNSGQDYREAPGLNAIIRAAPSELERYDLEVARLDAIYERIITGRDDLQILYTCCIAIVDSHICQLSPIRQLPLPSEISVCDSCDAAFKQSPLLAAAPHHSQFVEILRTNSGGNDSLNATELRTIICATPSELERYDLELARLDAIFKEIIAGRNALLCLYNQCVAIVHSPIRKLPHEVLVEIFAYFEQPKDWDLEPVSAPLWDCEAEKEIARVAGGSLVAISQVCWQWRVLALGTPTLWSTINLDMRCWTLPVQTARASALHQKMLSLLKEALERGEQAPLTVNVHGQGACHPHALQTLALAAPRWREATFALDCTMFKNLSASAGNLEQLESLTLYGLHEGPEALGDVMQYFSEAPKLRSVAFFGPVDAVAWLPLEQLTSCTYNGVGPQDLVPLFTQMVRFSSPASLQVQLNFMAIAASFPLELLAVVSLVEALDIYSMQHEGPDSEHVLDAIFGVLTLPNLQRLSFHGMPDYGQCLRPLQWPHTAALSLFARSASLDNLHSLLLHDVLLTQRELLHCLTKLPALTHLFISDHQRRDGLHTNAPHYLITDSLFAALSPPTKSGANALLLPRLEILEMRSLGGFKSDLLLRLLTKRTEEAGIEGRFECALLWFPGYPIFMDYVVETKLRDLTRRGELMFTCREFDPED